MSITAEKPSVTVHSAAIEVPALPAPRSFAQPAVLGLSGFALTTFVLSLANAGLIPGAGAAALAVALFYGGIAQVIAGIWEFANGNTFASTAFVSYGSFWLSFWWLSTNSDVVTAAGGAGVGAFLLGWAIFTAFMTIVAVKTNGVLLAVFVGLLLTLVALSAGSFSGVVVISQIGGWLGLVTAVIAWYGAFAVVLNTTWNREVLPLWASK